LTGCGTIEAVLFDCDGVLVDSEVLAHEVGRAMLAEIGLDYDRADYIARFMGMSDAAFFAALEEDGLCRLGRSIVDEIRAPMKARLRRAMAARLCEVPGAGRALAMLTRPKAVASSSSAAGLAIKLRKTGLWDCFAPHIYAAEHVFHAKPAPDLFLHAARALGHAPETCVVIEDSLNGVKAGRAAGMRVWGFLGGGHMDETAGAGLRAAGAERLFKDWTEAASCFAAL
jgi:HAD superfamily hydrolase (TIGR01509 family)